MGRVSEEHMPAGGFPTNAAGDVKGLAAMLRRVLGEARVRERVALAPWTTFRVGGPADVVFEPENLDELRLALAEAKRCGVPVAILGGGSNILIADGGVRGLVLRLRMRGIRACEPARVRAESACRLNGVVRWAIAHELGGLERWTGTPGTVGGAICGNAHFGGRLISDVVDRVELVTPDGELAVVPNGDMGFAYDRSRVQTSGETVVAAVFALSAGESAETLRRRARESLAIRKRTQPLGAPSAGCVFQNPVRGRDPVPAGVPASAGALIEVAGLKGSRIGGAMVSAVHANFIVTQPGACAADVRALIERCRLGVRQAFGVELREELRYLGEFEGV
ncbi:MAG: UDP-N-acetylmuramate dehydrogenase [Acidobacteriota bacterium]